METVERTPQEIANDEHLNLLSIFYFIFGGLQILASFIIIILVAVFSSIFESEQFNEINNHSSEFQDFPFGEKANTGIFRQERRFR